MANALYDKGREAFLNGSISWLSDNIKICLVTSGYSPSLSSDQFLSAVGGGNIVATSGNLTTKTDTAGVADADDVTFTALTGSTVTYIVCYKDSGFSSTSPLIFIDDTVTGLPLTPSGADVTVSWSNGSSKIFKL